jgi:hypothetical protein
VGSACGHFEGLEVALRGKGRGLPLYGLTSKQCEAERRAWHLQLEVRRDIVNATGDEYG